MTFRPLLGLALFAFGTLGAWEWIRDAWRARNDRAIDRHPMAVALRTLADDERRRTERERAQAAAMAERLRRREVVAECEFFDIDAAMSEAGGGGGQNL